MDFFLTDQVFSARVQECLQINIEFVSFVWFYHLNLYHTLKLRSNHSQKIIRDLPASFMEVNKPVQTLFSK